MQKIALLALLPGLVPNAAWGWAQAGFGQQIDIVSRLISGVDVESIDLDGDGDRDLIASDRGAGEVVWFENLGASGFGTSRLLPLGADRPNGLAVLDVNQDGAEDLLVAENGASPQLTLFTGSGGLTFTRSWSTPSPVTLTHRLDLADVDGDGDLDVTFTQSNVGSGRPALVAFQRSAQEFKIQRAGDFRDYGRSSTFADVDGDGDLDLVTSHTEGQRFVRPYVGQESFGDPLIKLFTEFLGGPASSFTAGDFDQDGDVDLVAHSGGFPQLLENRGGGAFADPVALDTSGNLVSRSVAIDMDGDADLDLVYLSSILSASDIAWAENLGGLQFSAPNLSPSDTGFFSAESARLMQIDASGPKDLVVLDVVGAPTLIPGRVAAPGQLALGSSAIRLTDRVIGAAGAAAADWDGDGDLDLIWTQDDQLVSWCENVGPGRFLRPATLDGVFGSLKDQQSVDLDGDGRIDILGRTFPGDLVLLRNLADGRGEAITVADLNASPASLQLVLDFDEDGDLDVLAVDGGGAGDLQFIEQLTPLAFADPMRVLDAPGRITALAQGDMDADGRIDIVLAVQAQASSTTASFYWLRALGSGAVSPPLLLEADVAPVGALAVEDLDGSPTPELIWLSVIERALYVSQGSSQAMMATPVLVRATEGQGRILNVDRGPGGTGRDLIVAAFRPASGQRDRLDRYRWLGGIDFAPAELITGRTERPIALAFGDFDGDGDRDMASFARGDGRLAWYPADVVSAVGSTFCPAVPNATGRTGELVASGSEVAAENQLRLTARDLPANATTLFLCSQTTGVSTQPGGSLGTLCLSGQVGRFLAPGEAGPANADGSRSLTLDLFDLPQPSGSVSAAMGQSWAFQVWHREPTTGGAPSSNFTEATLIQFQ